MSEDPVSQQAVEPAAPSREPAARPPGVRLVPSRELLQDQRELWIEHRGQVYRLRLTPSGRLYLTK